MRQDLIYVSVSGLGDEGPFADRRVYDIVVQGMAGFVSVQSDPATGEPRPILQTIVDKITALTIWQAATAALLHRERTGEGQHVKINMLKAGLAFLWPDAMGNVTLEGEGVRPGATMADISRAFPTADGRLMAGYVSDDEWQALCRALGRRDLADDARFQTIELRTVNTTALNELLADAFRQRNTACWLEALEREGAIYAPINTPAEVASNPQICQAGGIHRHEHPVVGRYVQPGHPIDFGATPHLAHGHAPQLGVDGPDILREFGIGPLPDRKGHSKKTEG